MEQRELLFRQPVFKANGHFKQWHYFKPGERMADYIYVNSHPRPVMQWTGLLDSKGVKIFEGDIVKAEGWNPELYLISFIEGAFCATFQDGWPVDLSHFYDSTGCAYEVIGNIYTTPELLPTPNAEDRS